MCVDGDEGGVQGGLKDRATLQRSGIRDGGGIYSVLLLWLQNDQEEDWRFLLIVARNAFNQENRIAMLWEVQHKWPSGARFAFN